MKKKPPVARRDVNKDHCFAAGRIARQAGMPITGIEGLNLLGSFGSTRAEDLQRAWKDGWTQRDAELRADELRRKENNQW